MKVVLTENYNIMVNSEEFVGTTEYLTLQGRHRINRCRYNWVRLHYKSIYYVHYILIRKHGNLLSRTVTLTYHV
jgi:hypothetical protein